MTLHAWRRATQAVLWVTPVFLVGDVAVGKWVWASMLTLLWVLCLVSYLWARHQAHEVDEITAYHDWLQWKINQQ